MNRDNSGLLTNVCAGRNPPLGYRMPESNMPKMPEGLSLNTNICDPRWEKYHKELLEYKFRTALARLNALKGIAPPLFLNRNVSNPIQLRLINEWLWRYEEESDDKVELLWKESFYAAMNLWLELDKFE